MPSCKWVAPRISSTETRGAIIAIPASPEMVAAIRGLLLDLTNPAHWQELEGVTISSEEAASLGLQVLESFEESLF